MTGEIGAPDRDPVAIHRDRAVMQSRLLLPELRLLVQTAPLRGAVMRSCRIQKASYAFFRQAGPQVCLYDHVLDAPGLAPAGRGFVWNLGVMRSVTALPLRTDTSTS